MRAKRALAIPEGFRGYGWHSFPGGNLAKLSVGHLVPESQFYTVRGGTEERTMGPALCGRSMHGRGTRNDPPATVEREMKATGENARRPCTRCFELALQQTTHQCANTRQTGGIPWGARRPTTIWQLCCSCGAEARLNETKRGAETAWREHVRGAAFEGVFRVEGERLQTQVVVLHRIAWHTGNYTNDLYPLRELEPGKSITVHGNKEKRGQDFTVTCVALALLVSEEPI